MPLAPESLGAPLDLQEAVSVPIPEVGIGNPMSKESNSAALVRSRSNLLTADPEKGRNPEFFF